MNKRAPKLIASAFLVVTLATACGGGRPSVDEVSQGLEDNAAELLGGSMPTDSIDFDCMAEAFVDSDLSDDALQAIVDGDEDFDANDGDTEAASEAAQSATDCVEVPEMPGDDATE